MDNYERHKIRVNISINPAIHEYIKQECEKKGTTFSQWVTDRIVEYRDKKQDKKQYKG